MRSVVAVVAFSLVLGAGTANAGRIPVTEDRFEGTKRVISIAEQSPRKRYRVTVGFADTRQRVVRWMRSGDTIRIEVGNRPHSLAIRCIPKKKRRA